MTTTTDSVIVIFGEAQDEARRLTKVHGRSVEVKAVQCCQYNPMCGCGGQGLRYELVFPCDHLVGDGELIDCHASGCLDSWREEEVLSQVEHPKLPLHQRFAEQDELEVA